LEQQRVWQRSGQRSGQGIAAQRRQGLDELAMRLEPALANCLQRLSSLLATQSAALPVPRQEIELARRELLEQSRAWQRSGQSMEQQRRQRLNELATGLAAHEAAHHALKAQGYVTVHSASGTLIAKAKDIKAGQPYLLRYAEGEARVLGAPSTPPKSRSALPAKRSGKTVAKSTSQQPKLI
jgi:exonuclease VII large subunit